MSLGVVSAVAAIAGTAYSVYSAEKQKGQYDSAARDQERLSQRNALMGEAEARREQTLVKRQQEEQTAAQRARAGASGVSGGSQDVFFQDLENRNAETMEWMQRSAKSRSSITRAEGRLAAKTTKATGSAVRAQAYAGAISSLPDIYKHSKQAGSDLGWW